MIRRGLLLLIGSSLLGLLTGCHCCQGRCDCQTYAIGQGTPRPYPPVNPPATPVGQPLDPVLAH